MTSIVGADNVSTHSRLKAAGYILLQFKASWAVSTHSRLKAAGVASVPKPSVLLSFNTQPPKGGWPGIDGCNGCRMVVSTHSRLKAAGFDHLRTHPYPKVSTHSRLKAAGAAGIHYCNGALQFQHTAA